MAEPYVFVVLMHCDLLAQFHSQMVRSCFFFAKIVVLTFHNLTDICIFLILDLEMHFLCSNVFTYKLNIVLKI